MVNFWLMFGIGLGIGIVGFAIGYLIWVKTRPKKETWTAYVYQLAEGIRPPIKNEKGQVISNLALSDLIPYDIDILEKIPRNKGINNFVLKKLSKSVQEPQAGDIEYWGTDKKIIRILLHNGSTSIIRSGYDTKTGSQVFRPLPVDRINTIKTEMEVRKERLKKSKDILQSITPFVVIAIAMLSLIAIVYMNVDATLKMNKQNAEMTKYTADKMLEATKIIDESLKRTYYIPTPNNLGRQNQTLNNNSAFMET